VAKKDFKEIEKVLKAFANRRRLAILAFLKRNGPASVGVIAKEIRLSFKSTSKHLNILSALDIVIKHQDRLNVFYEVNPTQSLIARRFLECL